MKIFHYKYRELQAKNNLHIRNNKTKKTDKIKNLQIPFQENEFKQNQNQNKKIL